MSTRSRQLWKEIDELFGGRSGWGVQALSTPGSPQTWCLKTAGTLDLWVTVEGDELRVFIIETEDEVRLQSVDQLVAWLDAHRPGSLPERDASPLEKAKRGKLFTWE